MRTSFQFFLAVGFLCVFASIGCHDAPRKNPVDPKLTPAVELVSVEVDSLQGTTTLVWTRYAGTQPFQAYRVFRRISGQTAVLERATIAEVADTVFVDAEVEADHVYVYNVAVINAAGLEVGSNEREVSFTFAVPRLEIKELSSSTASATLSWSRAVSGFLRYEVLRQAEGEAGPSVIHTTTAIDDTTFTDTGLDGNTEYTYMVSTRTSSGDELTSAPVSGTFHALLRRWEWVNPPPGRVRWITPDPTGGAYVSIGPAVNVFRPSLFEEPDQIYRLSSQGELTGQFSSEPASRAGYFEANLLAADDKGVYVLLKEPFTPTLTAGTSSTDAGRQMQTYVNAFDPTGNLRFRWPAGGEASNLANIASSPEGVLWVSRARKDPPTGGDQVILYRLNASTGDLIDSTIVEGVFTFPYFERSMVANEHFVILEGVIASDRRIILVEASTGEILLDRVTGERQSTAVDFALNAEGRLYLLYAPPPRIEVFHNWHFLATLPNINDPIEWLGLDSKGNIHVYTRGPSVRVYEP